MYSDPRTQRNCPYSDARKTPSQPAPLSPARSVVKSPLEHETLPALCEVSDVRPPQKGARHWFAEAYRRHLSVTGSALGSMTLAFAVSTGTAALIDSANKSSASASLFIVGMSFLAYYGTFIPQLAWKDRSFFRKDGKLSSSRIVRKIGEYASLIATQEVITTPLRISMMASLIKYGGFSSKGANVLSFIAINAFFMGMLPPLRHALQGFFRSEDA